TTNQACKCPAGDRQPPNGAVNTGLSLKFVTLASVIPQHWRCSQRGSGAGAFKSFGSFGKADKTRRANLKKIISFAPLDNMAFGLYS
ncbi:MAG: hypothetical protein MR473_09150, partial [Clostridiales bacterium]|nr:hypothetical protein [Clostridiales bacterium]